ncbi:MAG: XylR family transcriptional regulator [Tepidisphaeraceae bacterium]|jgi:LacI family transcriptional regulator
MKRSIPIALVIPVEQEYWRGVIAGIIKFAGTARPWLLSRFEANEADFERLASMEAAGIIAAVKSPELAGRLRSLQTPCVNVSSVLAEADFPCVCVDDAGIGQLAASHFLQRGMQNFAYVGMAQRGDFVRRCDAYVQRLKKERIPQVAAHDAAEADSNQARQALGRWLTSLPRPCAVFAANDDLARRVIDACREVPLHVPRDVAVLGCGDDSIVCGLATPKLSSVSLPAERVGYEAAALLERLMAGKRRGLESIVLPVSSVIGRASSDVVSVQDPQVAAALRFILARAGEWIGVRELLLAMPIQRRSLERRFRQVLGRSPLEEIRRVRLEIARELLATTDLPMPLVARRSGFSDGKQLSTVFRAEVGVTPTAYRAKFRIAGATPADEGSSDDGPPADE